MSGNPSHAADWYLFAAIVLYACGQALQMGTNAARLAGVRAKRVATGLTLFSLFANTARLMNFVYVILISPIIDYHKNVGDPAGLETKLRLVMLGSTVGILIGGVITPWWSRLLERGIGSFERYHSLPRAMLQLLRPATLWSALRDFRLPTLAMLRYSPANLPKGFLWWNVVVMAFWIAGPIAAYLASALGKDVAVTSVNLSGAITGIATITLTFLVDPPAALVTDQAAHGMRPESDVKAMLVYLIITAFIGSLLAQLLLHPAAEFIASFAGFLYGHGAHR